MNRRTLYVLAAVILVAAIAFFMLRKKSPARGSAFPSASVTPFPGTPAPRGGLWSKFGKVAGVGSGTRSPRGTRAPGMTAAETSPPVARVSVPTISPEVFPPHTLGPVPNGITRVPEPPTKQPSPDRADFDFENGAFTLFTSPAGAGATIINGLNVPAVQNPWNVASWQFLRGADVSSALAVVKNLFPSFPVTTRSIKDGPRMSGAVTLVFDESNKVVQIVRD